MDKQQSGLSSAVMTFIQNYRVVIFGVLGLTVAALIGLAVYGLISYNSAMEAAAQVDRASIRFDDYRGLAADDSQKAEKETDIVNMLRPFVENKTEPYAGAKALWVMAELEGVKENKEAQIQYLQKLLEWYPGSHRNIEASFLLAGLYLESGKEAEGVAILENLKDASDLPAFYREEILFVLASQAEKSDKPKALEIYKQLVDLYPLSDWTKLARSRILFLELNT